MKKDLCGRFVIPGVILVVALAVTGCSTPIQDVSGAQRSAADPAVSVAATADGGVALSWSPVSNAASYEVWRNNERLTNRLSNNSTTVAGKIVYVDRGINSGEKYTYQVMAQSGNGNGNGNGKWTGVVKPNELKPGCGGSGVCTGCLGTGNNGTGTCPNCDGTGICPGCNGEYCTGANCSGCQGTGACQNSDCQQYLNCHDATCICQGCGDCLGVCRKR